MLKINHSIKSANYSTSENHKIDKIILHYTEVDEAETFRILTAADPGFSAHYVITQIGEIFNLVDEQYKAFHAGVSFWQGEEALNNSSIGIEIVNNGNEEFSESQIESVIKLSQNIKARHDIQHILGHSDIAIPYMRKIDPGIYFPWKKLAVLCLGKWPDFEIKDRKIIYKFGDEHIEILQLKEKLKLIGYKINNLNNQFDQELENLIKIIHLHYDPALYKLVLLTETRDYKEAGIIYDSSIKIIRWLAKITLHQDPYKILV